MHPADPEAADKGEEIGGNGMSKFELSLSDCVKTALTGNMDLIDRLNSDIEKEREEATAEAIAFVQEQSL